MPVRRSAAGLSRLHRKVGLPGRPASPGGFASARVLPGQRQAAPPGKVGSWEAGTLANLQQRGRILVRHHDRRYRLRRPRRYLRPVTTSAAIRSSRSSRSSHSNQVRLSQSSGGTATGTEGVSVAAGAGNAAGVTVGVGVGVAVGTGAGITLCVNVTLLHVGCGVGVGVASAWLRRGRGRRLRCRC